MIKKLLICILGFVGSSIVEKAHTQTLTVGVGAFTNTSNLYGPLRTITTTGSWGRNAYIYPASLVNTIPANSTISSIEFYSTGITTMPAGANFKIYIKNTTVADFGAANLDWVAEAATNTLVYDGDPATIIGTTTGYKQFPFSSAFTYAGNNLEVLVEYTQTAAPTASILWTYDSDAGVPAYTVNQGKYVGGTGSPTATTTGSNQRHPNMKLNYTAFVYTNDMATTTLVAPSTTSVTAGVAIPITVTVKNSGSANQTSVPVYYRVDGGTPVGPVSTGSLPLAQNATTNVTLPNYTPTSGYHTIKAYTALGTDQNIPNDTLTFTIFAGPINTFPFMENFTYGYGWSANATIWGFVTVSTQANGIGGKAVSANFFNSNTSVADDTLRSPAFNFTGLTKPILSFNFTHQAYTAAAPEHDSLSIIVSTDGGTTWGAPIYTKSAEGSPSLNTIAASNTQYNPQAKGDWRHEMVDLTAYAGQSNVKIGFIAISGFGNQLVIDNVLLSNAASYTSQAVTATGAQAAIAGVTLNFTTIIPNGKLKVAKFNGAPISSASPVIAANTTATTQDGSTFTPTLVSNGFWYTVTYDSLATYSISIDISTLPNAPVKTKLYIVKRASQNDSWTAVTTTLSGNILTASGLTAFSDFAIAGDASNPLLPLQLLSFQGQLRNNNATLSWSTSTENGLDKFEVERSGNNSIWTKIGTLAAKGSSSSYQIMDANLSIGKWLYRLKMVDKDGSYTYSSIVSLDLSGKTAFVLNQNYPNPVKGSTQLSYQINTEAKVMIELLTNDGRKIATLVNQQQAVGAYNITVDLTKYGLSSGNYLYRMSALGKDNEELFQSTRTITVVR